MRKNNPNMGTFAPVTTPSDGRQVEEQKMGGLVEGFERTIIGLEFLLDKG